MCTVDTPAHKSMVSSLTKTNEFKVYEQSDSKKTYVKRLSAIYRNELINVRHNVTGSLDEIT